MESLNSKNLSSVTSATTGLAVNTDGYPSKVVWVNISGNTGAVTVRVQGSPNRDKWATLNESTFTTNGDKIYTYDYHLPVMRTLTATQSNSTVTTFITGGE